MSHVLASALECSFLNESLLRVVILDGIAYQEEVRPAGKTGRGFFGRRFVLSRYVYPINTGWNLMLIESVLRCSLPRPIARMSHSLLQASSFQRPIQLLSASASTHA